jgi:2'-5' RNA ligase
VPAPDFSDGVMVALLVPEETGERLALSDEDALPADDLHITLAYLGTTDDDPDKLYAMLTAVRDGAHGHKPIRGSYNGVGRFSGAGTEGDALYLSFDSPDIASLRADIVEALTLADQDVSVEHGFIPHTTLAYLSIKQESPLARLDPIEVSFDRVHLVYGDASIPVPLAGGEPEDVPSASYAGSAREYPSTTSPTVNKETKDAAFEGLHPRAGGKFAPKSKPAGAEQDPDKLPENWLDRVLKGDPRYVEAKKGKKAKKGKSKAAADRAARSKIAKIQGDTALSAEMDRRNTLDEGMRQASEAETERHQKAQDHLDAMQKAIDDQKKAVGAETDPAKKAAGTERLAQLTSAHDKAATQEKQTRRTFATAKRKLKAAETSRRRAFEHARRAAQLTRDAAALVQARADVGTAAKDGGK